MEKKEKGKRENIKEEGRGGKGTERVRKIKGKEQRTRSYIYKISEIPSSICILAYFISFALRNLLPFFNLNSILIYGYRSHVYAEALGEGY